MPGAGLEPARAEARGILSPSNGSEFCCRVLFAATASGAGRTLWRNVDSSNSLLCGYFHQWSAQRSPRPAQEKDTVGQCGSSMEVPG